MFLLKKFWGRGYGFEALNLFLHHSFSTLNKKKIRLVVYEKNFHAIAIYEKLGFQATGKKSVHPVLVSAEPKLTQKGVGIEMALTKNHFDKIKLSNENWPMNK
jgi:RimJ/RimL family protein N-acetyltransferase